MHLLTYVTELALAAEPSGSQVASIYPAGTSSEQAGFGPRAIRRRGRGRRVRRPVHAVPAAPGRASVRVFESAGDVGGTWYWNRYPGRPLRRPHHGLHLQLRPGAGEGVDLVGEVRDPAGDPALPAVRGRPLRAAPRHRVLDRRRRGPWDEPAKLWTVAPAAARRCVPVLRDGHRLPVGAQGARHRGRRPVRRARSTSPAAGRTRASTSPASGSRSSAPARRASSRSRSSPSRPASSRSSSAPPTSPSRRTTAPPRPSGWSSWTRTGTPTGRGPVVARRGAGRADRRPRR